MDCTFSRRRFLRKMITGHIGCLAKVRYYFALSDMPSTLTIFKRAITNDYISATVFEMNGSSTKVHQHRLRRTLFASLVPTQVCCAYSPTKQWRGSPRPRPRKQGSGTGNTSRRMSLTKTFKQAIRIYFWQVAANHGYGQQIFAHQRQSGLRSRTLAPSPICAA